MIRQRLSLRIAILVTFGSVWLLFLCCSKASADNLADEESLLPFATTDQLIVVSRDTKQTRKVSGVIEDISGQVIVLRRNPADVDVFTLRDVVRIEFRRSTEFDDGLRHLRNRDYKPAISSLKSAVGIEPRKWAVREIKAMLARAFVGNREFENAVSSIEDVMSSDPNTRHVVELPLVWDDRLPAEARMVATTTDLKSESVVRRFTAASALLHDPSHQGECVEMLKLLTKSTNAQIQKLAETQLWRLKLLSPQTLNASEVQLWHKQIGRLDRRTRSGPEFLCGRAHLLLNEYDLAATSLLWMPLLEPLDPETTRASLMDAASALELSGRKTEAVTLRAMDPVSAARR